jgi:FlaA1/EpsC-like NDP-sugar epimerase
MGEALGLALLLTLAGSLIIFHYPSPGILVLNALVSGLLLSSVRFGFRIAHEKSWHTRNREMELPGCRIAIIGAGELAAQVASQLARLHTSGLKIAGFFDDDSSKWHRNLNGIPVIGMPELLLEDRWRQSINGVLVAAPEATPARLCEIKDILEKANLGFEQVPSVSQMLCSMLKKANIIARNYSPAHSREGLTTP